MSTDCERVHSVSRTNRTYYYSTPTWPIRCPRYIRRRLWSNLADREVFSSLILRLPTTAFTHVEASPASLHRPRPLKRLSTPPLSSVIVYARHQLRFLARPSRARTMLGESGGTDNRVPRSATSRAFCEACFEWTRHITRSGRAHVEAPPSSRSKKRDEVDRRARRPWRLGCVCASAGNSVSAARQWTQ